MWNIYIYIYIYIYKMKIRSIYLIDSDNNIISHWYESIQLESIHQFELREIIARIAYPYAATRIPCATDAPKIRIDELIQIALQDAGAPYRNDSLRGSATSRNARHTFIIIYKYIYTNENIYKYIYIYIYIWEKQTISNK